MVLNLKRFLTELTEQEVIAKEILIHPSFNRRNLQNDICLIKTEKMILGKSSITSGLSSSTSGVSSFTSGVSSSTSGGKDIHFRYN